MIVCEGVWLDDRRRCTWAVCDLTLEVADGQTVALVAPADQGAPDAVIDLVLGRRRPTCGRFRVPPQRDVAVSAPSFGEWGEHRVVFGDGTTVVAWPSAPVLAAADVVVRFAGGFEVGREVRARPGRRLPAGVPAA